MNSIMSVDPLRRHEAELAAIRARIAEGRDEPVLMLNLNTYTPAAGFPHGAGYRAYMAALEALLGEAGARILWRYSVKGQMVGGAQDTREVLGIWYPSGEAFLDLPNRPGADESYRLREPSDHPSLLCRAGCARHPPSARARVPRLGGTW